MESIRIIVDLAKCVGCFNCLMACKDEFVDNDWLPYTESQEKHFQKWIEPTRHERGNPPYTDLCYVTRLCQHCDEPACQNAFPMVVDKREDGIVLLDVEESKGNKELVDACPYGMISYNEDKGTAQKCNMCVHLLDNGWAEPRCVQACPLRALSIVKCEDEEFEKMVSDQELKPITDGSNKPRVLYKNLEKYTCNFIAGDIAFVEGDIEYAAEGAKVELLLNEVSLKDVLADEFGQYKFDNIPDESGTFEIRCSLEGYKPISLEATVDKESVCLPVSIFEKQ